jgi:CopG antitoxin of type II toxin-antitoxin system
MKDNKKKKIPKFKSEDEERKFWATADSTEYVNWSSAKRAI